MKLPLPSSSASDMLSGDLPIACSGLMLQTKISHCLILELSKASCRDQQKLPPPPGQRGPCSAPLLLHTLCTTHTAHHISKRLGILIVLGSPVRAVLGGFLGCGSHQVCKSYLSSGYTFCAAPMILQAT